jgi:uncharacterized membrane protein YuzA (DUF378 family)
MKKIFGTKGFQWYDVIAIIFSALGLVQLSVLGLLNYDIIQKMVGFFTIWSKITFSIVGLSGLYGLWAIYKLNKR